MAQSIDVFTCKAGKLSTVQLTLTGSESSRLIRSGSAFWSDGKLDKDTLHAMAERKGIWQTQPVARMFEVLNTTTPAQFLAAVSTVESGRNDSPWPWTINFNGRGYFFGSMGEAVDAAKYLIRSGFTDFDVGAMQVNWHFHRDRFTSIESAFDPVFNIMVADRLIQEHLRSTGSWSEAIGRYHSKTPSRKHIYLQKVNHHLDRLSQPNTSSRKDPC